MKTYEQNKCYTGHRACQTVPAIDWTDSFGTAQNERLCDKNEEQAETS